MSEEFAPELWRRFLGPQHAGINFDAAVTAKAGTPASEARLATAIEIGAGKVRRAGFLAHGCPAVIATAELLCERLTGMPVAEISPDIVADVESQLRLPATKRYCRLMAEDVLQEMAAKLGAVQPEATTCMQT